jgi:hypothetical protein
MSINLVCPKCGNNKFFKDVTCTRVFNFYKESSDKETEIEIEENFFDDDYLGENFYCNDCEERYNHEEELMDSEIWESKTKIEKLLENENENENTFENNDEDSQYQDGYIPDENNE